MQGLAPHGSNLYRCSPPVFTTVTSAGRSRSVHVREEHVVARLDDWIASLFKPDNLQSTVEALITVQDEDHSRRAQANAAQRRVADLKRRLDSYRKTLDAGGDPVLIAGLIKETTAALREAELQVAATRQPKRIGPTDAQRLVESIGDVAAALTKADPEAKKELYAQLGLQLTYDHARRLVTVEAGPDPYTGVRVGEGT